MTKARPGWERIPSDQESDNPPKQAIPLLIKHFARAVNRGQQITCKTDSGENVTGYLAGHDAASIFLLVPVVVEDTEPPRFTRKLIERAHVTSVDLHDEVTFQDEPCRAQMESILTSYRAWMARTYLSRRDPGGTP